ncbi:DUF1761 domain-containing protein [Promethearchaeum syntrophicum]|uniref:DUF1761 domain-containing protein n=1 Tax=Promethearchaeum syntrophicum TaxID=2594042 RepID=A0A5B9DDA3_9ARCH|nr:DUF1761 domain-containing protein [Candidatus Prometheoarchaeum syntrophicum]QEE16857.1 hypothetical protein DSAG12_02687 [Candidatus Prometheoarchaeum syntrophicum]
MINIWAILVGVVIYMILGMLWYNPILFGDVWMKMLNFKKEELEMKPLDMVYTIIGAILGTFFIAFIFELMGDYTFLKGLGLGAILAGIIFTTSSSQVIYSKKHWKLFLIDAGYHATSVLLISMLLGLWN